MAQSILIIEDDQQLGELLVEYLQQQQFATEHVKTAVAGIAAAKKDFTAIILDLMLPDGDGLSVCQTIRKTQQTPIIILTARGDTTDKIVGLEMGADDYLAKPFEPRELLARLKAIIRRSQPTVMSAEKQQFGRLLIDSGRRQAILDGEICELTNHQFMLLSYLAANAGRVLSREQLMEALKQQELEAFDRSIDVHISRIRAAIEDNPKQPQRIKTVRGSGYVFNPSQD